MFRALHASALPADHVFAVTVGPSSKMTLASWHLLEPWDVISTVGLLKDHSAYGEAGIAEWAEDCEGVSVTERWPIRMLQLTSA
jgi:hypothetical protein